MYDAAVEAIQKSCDGVEIEKVNSLKFHTNSWGLSSCNWFAENIVKGC
jgi:hypothetical protein